MRIAATIAAVMAVFAAPAAAAPARIAFSSDEQLWTMNADGSDARQLTHLRAHAYQPAWSPDGSTIAFTSEGGRIWTVASDGTGAQRLTPRVQKATYETSPAWSPDGTRIAFARTRFFQKSLRTSIMVRDADSGNERTVVSERLKQLGSYSQPGWSPAGERLVVTRAVVGKHNYFQPSIFSVALDGTDRRPLASGGSGGSYSPDGTKIAFVSVRDRNGEQCGSDECWYRAELYVMNADGSGMTRLTRNKGDEQSAAWSPDGGRIAFSSTRNYPRGEAAEVYSIRPDGSCLTWLTNGTAESGMPAWEPGASLSSDPGGCGAVDRAPVANVRPPTRTRPRAFEPLWLGPVVGGNMLLSHIDGASLYYDDCGSFEPKQCGGPVDVEQHSSCRLDSPVYKGWYVRRLRRLHGALVFDGRRGVDVYTGTTALTLYGGGPAGAAALRPFGADAAPASLPPPLFGETVWRKLGRAGRARLRALGAGHRHCAPGIHR